MLFEKWLRENYMHIYTEDRSKRPIEEETCLYNSYVTSLTTCHKENKNSGLKLLIIN
jgi:hypothetical protein